MEDSMEEAVKGWIACAMEIRGYTSREIWAVMESAYRYQHGEDGISVEDAVNQYQYYRPTQETRLLAAREAAV
ncbi:MAG: hypothetical protein IKR84_02330 [Oscillibacter sp.]|nr:hypothetical protein [Oscillibacter sp.]